MSSFDALKDSVTVTLKGKLGRTFGGFTTIRGYAKFSDIVKCSEPKKYQRGTIEEHLSDIEKFYEKGENIFFPEVILSLELKYDFDKPNAISGIQPLQTVINKEAFKSNVDNVSIKTIKSRDEVELSVLTHLTKLGRIDGNHRLSAGKDDDIFNEEIPFCVVLFEQGNIDKPEKELFFNINSKAVPLTTEETLKAILDDNDFSDDDLKTDASFGWEYFLARKVKEQMNYSLVPHLKASIEDKPRTFLVESFKYLLTKKTTTQEEGRIEYLLTKEEGSIELFISKLSELNTIFADKRLSENKCTGLLGAFLYYSLKSKRHVLLFKNWTLKNHIYKSTDLSIDGFVQIFDMVLESKRKEIFVSMQFCEETKPNFEAVKSAVDDINRELDESISIREIRIDQFNTGFSYDINVEILNFIENCGLLIADLTMGNKNVYHEIGYLMGLNKGQGLSHENFILIHNSSIGDTAKDVGFNLVSIKQLRVDNSNSICSELVEQIKIYYGLK